MLDFPFARPFFRLQYFLHGFKQCGSYNWLKVSIKPFVTMFDEAEICTMSKKPFDGNFGKWRSVTSHYAQVRQKLRERNKSMRPFGVLLVGYFHNTRVCRMRLNIANARVVLVAKGS